MASRTLPGLGLKGFWGAGFNGWGDENDANLRLLSAVSQLTVLSITTSLPGSPSNGDIYIIPVGDEDEGKVAVRDDDNWVLFTPEEGWRAWIQDLDVLVIYDGAAWIAFDPGSGLEEAPDDGELYGRKGEAWAVAIPTGGTTGQLLAKASETDHDTEWVDPPEGGGSAYAAVVSYDDDHLLTKDDDAGKYLAFDHATSKTATIDTDANQSWDAGTEIILRQAGVGQLMVAAAGGVTINLPDGTESAARGQGATLVLKYVAADEWDLTGDLVITDPASGIGEAPLDGEMYGRKDGDWGVAIPTGGSMGQVLTKASGDDHDTVWDDTPASGAEFFTDLGDVPADYTDQAGKVPVVNDEEDGLEFIDILNDVLGADDWITSFTPVVTPGTGSITSYTSYMEYKIVGKMMWYYIAVNITNNGTGGAYLNISLPVTLKNLDAHGGQPVFGNSTSNGFAVQASAYATAGMNVVKYDFTYPVGTGQSIAVAGMLRIA